jgi:thioredoxin reductase (NADPH)
LELANNFKTHSENTGVKINILEPVETITKEKEYFKVKSSKDEYKSKAVIVTTGVIYKKLGIPGEAAFAGKGVSYCATCDGAFFKGKKVAVVGGGTGAAMAALNLSDLATEIIVVTRRNSLKISERIIESRLLKARNIKIINEAKANEIIGKTKVEALRIEIKGKDEILDVDGVFVEVGKNPRSDFLKGLKLETKNGYIPVNSDQMSNLPGLFAAGDIVYKSIKQVTVAVAQGTIAALKANDYIKNNF